MLFLWSLSSLAGPLTDALTASPSLGGPSGHCPTVGSPDRQGLGTFGTAWQPLGFSPGGAFASLSYEDSDALPRWVVTVQSLVDDKKLAEVVWEDPEGARPPLAAFLARDTARIEAVLQTHGITVSSLPAPGAFPLVLSEGVSLRISQERGPESEAPTIEIRTLLHRGASSKRVDVRRARQADVVGWLRSPYEERLVVLLAVREPGFEGTTSCRIRAVGAHLKTGW